MISPILLLLAFAVEGVANDAMDGLRENPASVSGGLVVCVEPHAARIGAQIMQKGGNAVDAAVATGFALAVTHPEAGNIGGGGFMVVRLANGECFTVDYRETAPALATPTMFLDKDGKVDKEKVDIGWLTVGVPGSVMGLWTAHQKAGKLPWRDVVEPAAQLAERGFAIDKFLNKTLAKQEKVFNRYGEPARVYLVDRKAPVIGHVLKLPELAKTLRLVAEKGPPGFYEGENADRIEKAMLANGGLVRKSDLVAYRPKIRPPVRGTYRGHEIISMPPPSSGGVVIIEMLNILEGFDLKAAGHNSPLHIHRLAETMKRAYLDRARHLGDPDFVSMPLDELLSKNHAEKLRKQIGDRAAKSTDLGRDILTHQTEEKAETTHYSVIDASGNMVATTTTLEDSFGSRVIAPGTGYLLNNEMHDFNVSPGRTDDKGLIGTPANLVAPGKRMLSSMTPTLVVKDNKPFLIVGSPGGRTIPNTTLQVILNVIDFGMPIQEAVKAARMHHQWMPDKISLEPSLMKEHAEELKTLGHDIYRRAAQGDAHSIWIDPKTGDRHSGIDRRLRGAAFGLKN